MKKPSNFSLSLVIFFILIFFNVWASANQSNALVDHSEFSTCMECHAPIQKGKLKDKQYPRLPDSYTVHWTIREFNKHLQFSKKHPGKDGPPYGYQSNRLRFQSFRQGRGVTYYDWPDRKVVEKYDDFCVPIFPNGDNFRCKFIGVNNTAYLVTYSKAGKANCCKFMQHFGPPKPTLFSTMQYEKRMQMDNEIIDWWIKAIPYPGPFGFGMTAKTHHPIGFWFRSAHGWSMMNFYNYSPSIKNKHVFDLPKVCLMAKKCKLLSLGN